MATHTVTFRPPHAAVAADEEMYPYGDAGDPGSVLDIALTHGVGIEHPCGGTGVCGRCIVDVVSGMENLSRPDEEEQDVLQEADDAGPDKRLACRAIVHGDVTVAVPQ